MTVHVCGTPQAPPCCAPGCGRRDTEPCQYALAGRLEGQRCGRPVCEAHAGIVAPPGGEARRMCGAHAERVRREIRALTEKR